MDYRMLGTLEVTDPQAGRLKIDGVKTRAVLAMLLIARNTLVPADRIAEQLWHGTPPPSAAGTVQAYVSRLRRALAAGVGPARRGTAPSGPLITRRPGYLLRVGEGELDADRFERLLDHATTSNDPACSAATLRAALALWRGPALAEFVDEEFAQPAANRLEELRLVAVERRAAADLALGRHLDLIGEVEQLVVQHPLRETMIGLLMTALYRAGRQSDALRAYQTAYRRLAAEIGVAPGPQLQALHAAILTHDAQLVSLIPADKPVRPHLPVALARLAGTAALVGRQAEIDALRAAWAATDAHGCRLVVVSGETGIGKSRLLAEFARTCLDDGAAVLLGRALDRQLVPYQPLVEALGDHLGARTSDERARLLTAAGPMLGPLLPSLFAATGSAREPNPPQPERPGQGELATRRYLMFEAATALLTAVCADTGGLLALEDLHMADRSTLSLLEHLVRRARADRLLIVATVDDAFALTNKPLRDLMTTLGSDGRLAHVPLAGLNDSEVSALLGGVPAAAARTIRQRTRGNPLFVAELADHPDGTPIPTRLRDLILARLGRLGPELTEVLGTAAVAGFEFETGIVATMLDCSRDTLDTIVDQAVDAGLVEEAGVAVRRLRFTHRVVFESLRGTLSTADESTLLHRLVGAVDDADSRADYAGVLARHFRLTAYEDARRAVGYSRRAGDHASSLLGFAEAAQHYHDALDTLDSLPGDSRPERGELLLRLGVARRATYERQASDDALLAAADLALALPDPDMLARAAWGLAKASEFSTASPDTANVLREGLITLPPGDSPVAVALSAGVARAIPADPDARPLARAAIAMARRLGDPESILLAESTGLLVTWASDNLQERLDRTSEVITAAQRLGWTELAIEARNWRAACTEEAGDFAAADADLAEVARWSEASRQPYFLALCRLRGAARALFEGRYAEADRLAQETVDGLDAGPDFRSGFAVQRFGLLRDLGRLDEIDEMLSMLVEGAPHIPAWRAARAMADVELGRPQRAHAELDRLMATKFSTLPPDWLWLSALGHLADVCVDLDHRPAAEVLYPLLLPYAERNIVLADGVQCTGSAARHLGGLAALLGRWPQAKDHFDAAIAANRRWSAAPWLARTQLGYAAAALTHDDDRELAGTLLTEAGDIIHKHRITGLSGRIATLHTSMTA